VALTACRDIRLSPLGLAKLTQCSVWPTYICAVADVTQCGRQLQLGVGTGKLHTRRFAANGRSCSKMTATSRRGRPARRERPPMQRLSNWLETLGMAEYARRFADNDIDFLILPELTDQDLEKIGVTSLGHRRKILKAIAALILRPRLSPRCLPALQRATATPTAKPNPSFELFAVSRPICSRRISTALSGSIPPSSAS
jgi:hypothetical protein